MPRSFFISLLLFMALTSSGQNDSLVKKINPIACDCFDEIKKTSGIHEDIFADCIAEAMEENSDLIRTECMKIYGDTSDESAYKLGQKIFESIKVDLVYDCYDYFVFMDSLSHSAL
jgi:hypothetical protein